MKNSLFGPLTPLFFDCGPCKPRYCPCQRPYIEELTQIEPKIKYEKKEAVPEKKEAVPEKKETMPEKKDPIKILVKLDCPRCCEKEKCCCEKEKCCCEHKCCCCEHECCCCRSCCCRKHRCCCEKDKCCDPCGSVLNSATGGAGPLPILAAGDLTAAIQVVSVTIDTCCLCDPSVLLNFTTQISLPAASTTTLVFQVLRSGPCNGTATPVGSAFTYTNTVVLATSDSFSFQVFDSNLRRGTYTYSVVLTTGTTATVAGVTLVNSTLSARATSD